MTNLIKMDFSVYKYNIIFVLVYSVFFSLFFEAIMSGTVALLCVYIVVISSLATEEADLIHLLHKSLPVTKGEIIGAKYAETIIIWIISMALCSVTSLISMYVRKGFNIEIYLPQIRDSVFIIVLQFSLMLFITDIIIPLIYKFGYSKGRIFISIIWIAAAFLIPSVAAGKEITLNYGIACAAALIAAIIVTLISYGFTVKIYKSN